MNDRSRLDCLDGLRGFSAVVVLNFHFLSALRPRSDVGLQSNGLSLLYTPLAVLWNGTFAVSVFFVLSGFVLTHATLQRADPIWIDGLLRYVRLAVPATLSTLLAWALLTANPEQATRLSNLTENPWLRWSYQGRIPDVFNALESGLVDIFITGGSYFNNALWTMRPELIGSYVCFLLCLIKEARSRVFVAIITAFAILLTKRYEYECFILGMMLQEAWVANRLPSRFSAISLVAGLIIGSQGGDAAQVFGLGWLPDIVAVGTKDSLVYPVAAGLAFYGCFNSPTAIGFLSSRLATFLGRISFPLYLIHVPVIYTIFSSAYLSARGNTFAETAVVVSCVTLIIGAAFLVVIYIEEPFVRFLKRLRFRLRNIGGDAGHVPN